MTELADDLGTENIGKLLIKQAVPATIGILVMSLNMIVDTIFVGQWIGVLAIAAITVVLPIAFLNFFYWNGNWNWWKFNHI